MYASQLTFHQHWTKRGKIQDKRFFKVYQPWHPDPYQWQPENTGDMVGPEIRTQDLFVPYLLK